MLFRQRRLRIADLERRVCGMKGWQAADGWDAVLAGFETGRMNGSTSTSKHWLEMEGENNDGIA
jgi:hypothetical protein